MGVGARDVGDAASVNGKLPNFTNFPPGRRQHHIAGKLQQRR
jgi:hypothetical protein